MSLVSPLTEAAAHWPPRGALIGLDLGTKTIGVAVSDPDRRLAAGVTTIARKTFTKDVQQLLALAAERAAVGIVLGLPVNMDGSEGPRAQSTRAFARIAADVSRAKRAAVIDQHAAAYILQGALDRLTNLNR
jgi:putative Holliday junction resolvase